MQFAQPLRIVCGHLLTGMTVAAAKLVDLADSERVVACVQRRICC